MKEWLARLLGRSGPPTVAVFLSGDPERSRSMAHQIRELLPGHPHIIIGPEGLDRSAYAYASELIEVKCHAPLGCWRELRRRLKGRWIALAPFVWPGRSPLRWMPWLLAPRKLLAFNAHLERHHLRWSCPIASWRFLRGDRVGDIFRPTALAGLRTLGRAIRFPWLLWRWAVASRAPATPLHAAARSRAGVTRVDPEQFWADPDGFVTRCATDRILVGSADATALDDPRVWLAFAGSAPAMCGERGSWALCEERPARFAFRRDVYCELGGAARGLTALSLAGWQRGRRTVSVSARGAAVLDEQLVFRAASDFRSAARMLWRNSPPLPGPGVHVFPGRSAGRRLRIAVVSPYVPFPLAHGGAIRIFNLLRHAGAEADIYLFAFAERETGREVEPLLDFCAKVVLVETPRWDPPSLDPPGVAKFRSQAMASALAMTTADEKIPIVQVEYTQLAHFGQALRRLPVKTILVEHDVTFDLHRQLRHRARGFEKTRAWLEEQRWRIYELAHARRFDRVIAMSEEDRSRLAGLPVDVVENGVDLERFQPAPPPSDPPELLFIGSFRHFPNVMAYRFLVEQVWPTLRAASPELRLTVVAGGDHEYYWRRHTGTDVPAPPAVVELLDSVEDVRPLYRRARIVLAPLVVSAGTNIKVLEALAMQRPLVATTVGVAGLGLTSGENVLLADRADSFAAAILHLLWNPQAREEMAAAGRAFVEARYGWEALARKLLAVWDALGKE